MPTEPRTSRAARRVIERHCRSADAGVDGSIGGLASRARRDTLQPHRNRTATTSVSFAHRCLTEHEVTASRAPSRRFQPLTCPRKRRPPMIHPSDPEIHRSVAVRDGHGAPVTCSACGCRLRAGTSENDIAWFHFNPLGGRDARGCRVDCVDSPHDVAGYRATSLALA
jgi:hypothetical protein